MCARAWPRCSPILILIGFTAVIAQVMLMRELIVIFSGNEISLGLMLAGWLLWTAFGSGVLGLMTARHLVAWLEILIALALPASIYAVRAARGVFHALPGEILGPLPMLVASLSAFSLFCAASGWLFAAGSGLYAQQAAKSTGEATGAVYLLEAAGSALGGILASLVLIRYLTAFEIAALLALLNLAAAASLLFATRAQRGAALAILAAIFAWFVSPVACPRLEAISLAQLWRGFRLVASRNSVYGNLAAVATEATTGLFENGLVILNVPDPAAAEDAVHYALLEHPAPRSLLLIGGGINGSVAEALRHPSLAQVDYVELDPALLDFARLYFPGQWSALRDPRVRVFHADGRLFVKTARRAYDVIIVNLPDPQTAQLNRFYTLEFFREAARRLNPGGVLSLRLGGAENYISPDLALFLRCIHKTLRAVFPEVIAFPGETVHFFAAAQPGILTASPDVLLSRLRARRLETVYVREYYIPFRLTPDRLSDLDGQIRFDAGTPVNRDFSPIAYYFDTALWSARFSRGREWFQTVARANFSEVAAGTVLLLLALAAAVRRSARATAGFCVAAMGFTAIGLEMLLLLGFQAIYGYVYHQLAILIAGFMAGMALGSWWGTRRAGNLVAPQFLAVLAPVVLCLLFEALAGIPEAPGVAPVLFPVLAVLCGALGGWQFPVASRIFFAVKPGSPGALYALDLAGSCLGAVLFSAYLAPVFGFLRTALLIAAINLAPAFLAARSRALRKPAP